MSNKEMNISSVEEWLRARQQVLLRRGYSARAGAHLGALVLEGLRDTPDFLLQIDGATGQEERCASVLRRSVQCARALAAAGLRTGDVIALMDVNHIDICLPLYAAYYLGVTVANISYTLKRDEIEGMFGVMRPKMVFCQDEISSRVQSAIDELQSDTRIVTFGPQFTSFIQQQSDLNLDSFRAAELDPEEAIAVLMPSSGTTGDPKIISLTHKNLYTNMFIQWRSYNKFPNPERLVLVTSLLPWVVGTILFTVSAILSFTRLSSSEVAPDAVASLIKKYKPSFMLISPMRMRALLRRHERDGLDLTCFQHIRLVGYAAPQRIYDEIKLATPKTAVSSGYGITEISGSTFDMVDTRPGSVGRAAEVTQYKLVDPWNGQEVTVPKVTGELWVKGPVVMKGYYKNPQQTRDVITDDGWFRSGDILYRDENNFYYFVDRLKNYFSNEVPAAALEAAIAAHPGVEQVAVVAAAGDEPVACVVPAPGHSLTAADIDELVRASGEKMRLSGGVVFAEALPTSTNGKLDRKRLTEFVLYQLASRSDAVTTHAHTR